jgi:hypothetical protein
MIGQINSFWTIQGGLQLPIWVEWDKYFPVWIKFSENSLAHFGRMPGLNTPEIILKSDGAL